MAHSLTDLSKEFASVGQWGRSNDDVADGAATTAMVPPRVPLAKTMTDPYGHVVDEIQVKTSDFQ